MRDAVGKLWRWANGVIFPDRPATAIRPGAFTPLPTATADMEGWIAYVPGVGNYSCQKIAGSYVWSLIGAAAAAPGGAGGDTQVIYNDGGVLAGDAGLTYNKTTDYLTVTGGLTTSGTAGQHTVINEGGVAADFRVESDGNANALYVDGTNNRVGILNAAPAVALDVTGEARVSTAGTNAASVVTVGGTQTLTNKTLTTPTIGSQINANHDHSAGAGGGSIPSASVTGAFVTLGPFWASNVPGTATTSLFTNFNLTNTTFDINADTATAYMPKAGKVVGGLLASNAARSGGTAILRASIAGVTDTTIAFATLDATNTVNHAALSSTGVSFAAGQQVGPTVVTASWTPTTADMRAYLVVKWDP